MFLLFSHRHRHPPASLSCIVTSFRCCTSQHDSHVSGWIRRRTVSSRRSTALSIALPHSNCPRGTFWKTFLSTLFQDHSYSIDAVSPLLKNVIESSYIIMHKVGAARRVAARLRFWRGEKERKRQGKLSRKIFCIAVSWVFFFSFFLFFDTSPPNHLFNLVTEEV